MVKNRGLKREHFKYISILLIVVMVPKVIVALMQNPIKVSDELGTLAAPAYLAGLDWCDIWAKVAYYGTGFHSLLTPLFWITDNPYIIYRSILIIYVLFETVMGCVVYYICVRYFNVNRSYACLSAIICSYFLYNKATWVSNESIIAALIWITLLIVLKLYEHIDNMTLRRRYTCLLMFMLAYSITVHLRLAVMYVGVAIIVAYILICKKKLLISYKACIVSGFITVLCALLYNDWIQETVWLQFRTETYLHNASASSTIGGISKIFMLTKKEYWKAFFNVIIGQLDTASVMSFGTFGLSVLIALNIILKTLKMRNKTDDRLMNAGIIGIFGGFGSASLLGMQAITWLDKAKITMDLGYGIDITNTNINFSRVFVYMRYFAPFMGVILLVGLVYVIQEKNTSVFFKTNMVLIIVGQLYWLANILPYLYKNIATAIVYIPFSFSSYTQECSKEVYLGATIVLVQVFMIIMILNKKKHYKALLGILAVGVMYQYLYYGVVHSNTWHDRADSGYELVQKLEEEFDLQDDLYLPYKAMAYTYQLMLCRYTINNEVPDDTVQNALLFTNRFEGYRYDEYIDEKGYTAFKLDDNEYVYVLGDDLVERMNELGYKVYE